jgi:hypothetical protein
MQTSTISYESSVSKSRAPNLKEMVYYSKHKTFKSETLHKILNMSKHYNRIVELKLRLLEEPSGEIFVVPHVFFKHTKDQDIVYSFALPLCVWVASPSSSPSSNDRLRVSGRRQMMPIMTIVIAE